MRRLQVELCKLQDWVKREGLRITVVFEGRDAAGKGGTIKAITERVSPRVFRSVALPAPSDREKTQMYMQRYMQHFPGAGEIVIFDRSWYNRARVECVMGFCSKEEHRRFLEICPEVERFIVDAGVQLIKFWLEVGDEEQKRRFEARIDDPLRQWKLSTMDMPSRSKWYAYSRARDQMLEATDTEHAPWHRTFRRQAARTPEPHRAFPQPHSLRGSTARKGGPAQAIQEGRLRRRYLDCEPAVRPGKVLKER